MPPRPVQFPEDAVRRLARDLKQRTTAEVRFSPGSRALYAHDLSAYRQVPIGVVIPRTTDDVVVAVEVCRDHGAPILPRGAGTSLGGQTVNVAVVLDCSKYLNRILEVDPDRRLARVEPGVVCQQLRAAAEPHGLTWGPDPATYEYCTLGGMIANNSCGVHSVMSGRTSDNVEALEIVTSRGERMTTDALPAHITDELTALRDRVAPLVRERYPDLPRRVSGYNLDDLLPERYNPARALAGTEGTCAITLEATVRLVPWPPHRVLALLAYPDQFEAADQVPELLAHGPIGLEAVDSTVTANMRRLGINVRELDLYPPGGAWLLAEFGGETLDEALEKAHAVDHRAKTLFTDYAEQKRVWLVRESAIGASRVPGELETWSCWEDSAVHPDRLGAYLRDFRAVLDRFGYQCVFFGHYGDGCIHSRISFDLKSADGVRRFRAFMEEASDVCLAHGGSLSGEHGDGQSHAELLPKMFGPELVDAFREFKRIWDPDGRLNPGKVVDPYPLDSNLRLGAGYEAARPRTHFSFARDGGAFGQATERCFGVGKCRRTEGGTMCPSYKVTGEEMHSTRGRAHLLFELLRGEVISGWRDKEVLRSLDLCLACKGCKGDCPVSVDVATYKAEFLAQHYRGRLRPPAAYALGLVHWWARWPRLFNAVAPWTRPLAGITTKRPMPRFVTRTFVDWFRERPVREEGERIVLWPDTFTNHLQPDVGIAAVEVLEAAGYRVELPSRRLCCGRPLYDFGMLKQAKRQLARILDTLDPDVPVVGLEPSCVAVFRDELPNLFPGARPPQVLTLAELLADWQPPRLDRRALFHAHCHHKAVMKTFADEALLRRVVDLEVLDSGCCGLAGSFGYEAGEKYEVSMQVGELALLPAVREAPEDTLVITDGFSCRQQIAHGTGRRALHVAEVLRLALSDAVM